MIEIPLPVIALGTVIGLVYGLLAVGIVLIYRTNRIINFAHGEIGAFGAAVFGIAVTRWSIPYYISLPLAIALGGLVGTGIEVAVIRRLRNAPRLMSIVATLGMGQFLVLFSSAVNAQARAGFTFPEPPGLPVFHLGALVITRAYSGMLFFAPVLVVGLVLFLRYTRYGIGIQSAAANPDAARMSGIFAGRMSGLAWALAGAVSTFTAVLVAPSRGFTSGESFGPSLLLRALAGAVIGRMTNMPVALGAGVGLGIIEQILLWNYPRAGFVEVALFVIIVVALLVQRREGGREEEKGSWAAVQAWRPLPEAAMRVFAVRHLGKIAAVVALVVAALLPPFITNSASISLVGILGFAAVGLSVGIVTGLGGQLSLGQFALAAIGATVSMHVATRTGNFALSFLYAGLAAAAVSLLLGLPALRLRGLMLTVTTLGFALVTPAWLLQQTWMVGEGADPGRPVVAGNLLDSGKEYYWFALGIFAILMLLAYNVRRGGIGRLLVAVRDNEENARAFTVRARIVTIQGFLLAGFIAGIGGALYGHALSRIGTATFPTAASVNAVALTVLGGVSILAGPLLGALYIIGVPTFVPLDAAGLAATSFGWLILILYFPGGLAQLAQPLRDRLVRAVARREGASLDEPDEPAEAVPRAKQLPVSAPSTLAEQNGFLFRPAGALLLDARDLSKRYGGVHAVVDVSVAVFPGETVGLIGPNGAGKTTLFELLGGFSRPDTGSVAFDGEDVSLMGPEDRGRRGLIRSFQDAALFPTMTVLDVVNLALERVVPTSFFGSLIGMTGRERTRAAAAREIVSFMGLDSYRAKQIQELSTGTRRITELACLVALRPTMLLLDEPSSGIAQRETEALGVLLGELKDSFNMTLFVIEHDIPLIMGLANRIVAMDAGRVIAAGTPAEVRTDTKVVQAYLGGSEEALGRSGMTKVGR